MGDFFFWFGVVAFGVVAVWLIGGLMFKRDPNDGGQSDDPSSYRVR